MPAILLTQAMGSPSLQIGLEAECEHTLFVVNIGVTQIRVVRVDFPSNAHHILCISTFRLFLFHSSTLKGNSHQEISVANMMELLLKSFLGITGLYSKPGRFPKGRLKCPVTSRSTW